MQLKYLTIISCAFLSSVLFLVACTSTSPTENEKESPQLHRLFEEAWSHYDSSAIENPTRFISKEFKEEQRTYYKQVLEELAKYELNSLSREDQINLRIFKFLMEDKISQIENESYLIPINAEGGFHTSFAFAPSRGNYKSEDDYEQYIAKLDSFKTVVALQIAMMEEGIEKDKTLSSVVMPTYTKTIEPYISDNLEESPFYKPFKSFPETIDQATRKRIEQKGRDAISNSVIPAYQHLLNFFEEVYIPKARKTVGIGETPNGQEWYEQRVNYYTTLDMSPDDVFNKGQSEVKRIRAEMDEIIKRLNFKGSYADFLNFLRTDPQFYPKSGDFLLKEASWLAKKAEAELPKYFKHLPRNPFTVEPVPDHIAPRYTAGRYVQGNLEQGRPGIYWVNVYNLPSRTLYNLPALTLHEAVPGHHLQITLAQEIEGMPKFRKDIYLSCYGEGWGLYSEYLGKEMGMYRTDYEDFGRLTYEMWRACRLVVDVGMHAKGWTREQAIEFMGSNTALSLHEVNTEIDRYIGWPAQAVSYKIGELKIRELRKRAEDQLGKKFNIRDFHDVVLRNGSVPLFILEEEVDHYIQTVNS